MCFNSKTLVFSSNKKIHLRFDAVYIVHVEFLLVKNGSVYFSSIWFLTVDFHYYIKPFLERWQLFCRYVIFKFIQRNPFYYSTVAKCTVLDLL